MKCSKCGEECKENQRICIKCGSPLPVVPAMKDMEQELAEEVELFLDDEEGEQDDLIQQMAFRTQRFEKKLVDTREAVAIHLEDGEDQMQEETYGDDFVIGNEFSLDDVEMALHKKEAEKKAEEASREQVRQRKQQMLLEKKKRNKKIMITCIVVVICIAALVCGFFLFRMLRNDSKYKENYEQGVTFLEAGNYAKAVDSFKAALNYTNSDEKVIPVKYQMYQAYLGLEGYEKDAEIVLKDLIELDADNIDYYKALIDLYRKTGDADSIEKLLSSVREKDCYDILVDYNVDAPTASVESGEYGEFVRVDLSLVTGTKIYYTIAKDKEADNPISGGQEYKEQILINEEGTWSLKAVSVSANGAYSEVLTREYVVAFTKPDGPTVKPTNGRYSEFTDISVEYPSTGKVYYTIDGDDPTGSGTNEDGEIEEEQEYTAPFQMERGNHIYKFIFVSETGLSSDVVTRFYNFSLTKSYDYDEAVDLLKKKLYGQGILKNSSGKYNDNTYLAFDYIETPLINKEEYYVISFSMRTNSGKTVADGVYYGVNAVTGKVVNVSYKGNDEYEIAEDVKLELPVEETTTEAPTAETPAGSASAVDNNN